MKLMSKEIPSQEFIEGHHKGGHVDGDFIEQQEISSKTQFITEAGSGFIKQKENKSIFEKLRNKKLVLALAPLALAGAIAFANHINFNDRQETKVESSIPEPPGFEDYDPPSQGQPNDGNDPDAIPPFPGFPKGPEWLPSQGQPNDGIDPGAITKGGYGVHELVVRDVLAISDDQLTQTDLRFANENIIEAVNLAVHENNHEPILAIAELLEVTPDSLMQTMKTTTTNILNSGAVSPEIQIAYSTRQRLNAEPDSLVAQTLRGVLFREIILEKATNDLHITDADTMFIYNQDLRNIDYLKAIDEHLNSLFQQQTR